MPVEAKRSDGFLSSPRNLDLLPDEWVAGHAASAIGRQSDAPRRLRAAIYCRYSSDLQAESSIERQTENALRYIQIIGAELAAPQHLYADRALSGAYMQNRPDLVQLRKDAAADLFDIVVVEDVDRLSRDIEHLSNIYKDLQTHGIQLHASMRGRISLAEIAVHGFLSVEQREQLKYRTAHGRRIAARQGRAPGGPIYGYKSAPQGKGFILVDDDEADVVRRVFAMFDEGVPIPAIARILNKEKVASPYGRKWSAVCLRGTAKGGSGVLRNPRYKGVSVYNRTETVRSPGSGKRRLRPRSLDLWIVLPVPEWTIVDPDLWARVQTRLLRSKQDPAPKRSKVYDALFRSGIRCGCGARMHAVAHDVGKGRRMQCSAYVAGDCMNHRSIQLGLVEKKVLSMLSDEVLCETTVNAFASEYRAELERVKSRTSLEKATRTARMAALDAQLEASFVDRNIEGFSPERIAGMRRKWEAEIEEHRAVLRKLPRADALPSADPKRIADLRTSIADLLDRMPFTIETAEEFSISASLSALVPSIEVAFDPDDRGFTLRIEARLDGLLSSGGSDLGLVPVVRSLERRFLSAKWLAAANFAEPDGSSNVHPLQGTEWRMRRHQVPPERLQPVPSAG